MNTDQLKTFHEIVRLGSFSEVARQLGISQPAVSFQVQKLEQELGVRLIDRSQRTITLTQAGQRLLRFAESVASERESLIIDLDHMRDDVSGDLHIAASTIPGEFLLPPLLAVFKKRYPAVNIRLDVSDSLTVIGRVRDNTCEIGFCGVPPEGKDLASFKIGGDEIVLIVFPGHPFARKSEVTPDEIEGEPLIFREATSGTQRSLENLLAQAGIPTGKWTPNMVLGSTQSVVSAVAAGAGIAFVSSLAVKNCMAQGAVTRVGVKGLRLTRDFFCVYRPERIVSRLLEGFINYLHIETAHDGR
ncbi:MAG: selenium metabolism-associated LysR family transcriptional regulator [Dehalococcoidales bacterium]|jgi:DNA-binding transcriptional LysR family regulator